MTGCGRLTGHRTQHHPDGRTSAGSRAICSICVTDDATPTPLSAVRGPLHRTVERGPTLPDQTIELADLTHSMLAAQRFAEYYVAGARGARQHLLDAAQAGRSDAWQVETYNAEGLPLVRWLTMRRHPDGTTRKLRKGKTGKYLQTAHRDVYLDNVGGRGLVTTLARRGWPRGFDEIAAALPVLDTVDGSLHDFAQRYAVWRAQARDQDAAAKVARAQILDMLALDAGQRCEIVEQERGIFLDASARLPNIDYKRLAATHPEIEETMRETVEQEGKWGLVWRGTDGEIDAE